jgi:hypothetical protein
MILEMSTANFTILHVLISLVGIGTGLLVIYGFLAGKRLGGMNAAFLITTVLTSITGFFYPFDHLTPGGKVGIISLVILAIAIPARYLFHMAGVWRTIYVVGSAMALYLNVFVLVVQMFEKVSALKALAPTQKEPPFLIAQLTVLVIFVGLTILSAKKFRIDQPRRA